MVCIVMYKEIVVINSIFFQFLITNELFMNCCRFISFRESIYRVGIVINKEKKCLFLRLLLSAYNRVLNLGLEY